MFSFISGQEEFMTFEGVLNSFSAEKNEIEIYIKDKKSIPINFEYTVVDSGNTAIARVEVYEFVRGKARARIVSYYSIDFKLQTKVILRVRKEAIEREYNRLISLGGKYENQNKLNEALSFYLKASLLKEDDLALMDRIVKIYMKKSDNELLRAEFEKALEYIYNSLEYCDKKSTTYDIAKKKEAEVLKLKREYQMIFDSAERALKDKNIEKARMEFLELSKKYPRSQTLSQKVSQLENMIRKQRELNEKLQLIIKESNRLVKKENHYSAIMYLKENMRKYPFLKKEISKEISKIYLLGGDIEYQREKYSEALDYYNRALEYSPNDKKILVKKTNVKNVILSRRMEEAKGLYYANRFEEAKSSYKDILKFYTGNKICREMIRECDYQIYKREADKAFRAGNYENAIIYYKKAFELVKRQETINKQAEAYYKLSQRALGSNSYDSYEKYVYNYLKLKKQSNSALQQAKQDLKKKIERLRIQNSSYYNRALQSAERLFPGNTSYFIPATLKPNIKPSKPAQPIRRRSVKRYPPRDERTRREGERSGESEKKSSSKKAGIGFKPKSFIFITLNMFEPPDPIGFYAQENIYSLDKGKSQEIVGFGGGIGVHLSEFSFLEFSAHYHTKNYEYGYGSWDPFIGWIDEDGEIENRFINIDGSLCLKFNAFYFGGGGSFGIMSVSNTDIDELAEVEKIYGFGYHYGGGFTFYKDTIWIDFRQYNYSLTTPNGEKESFDYFVFGLRVGARF